MKIVMLLGDRPIQHHLAHKMSREFDVAGIVFSRNRIKPKFSRIFRFWQSFANRTVGRPLFRGWKDMEAAFSAIDHGPPNVSRIDVDEINAPSTAEFVREAKPDLVCVFGTNLLRKTTIRELEKHSRHGVMNLHTGLSPYIKGGPNCTNWCLSLNRPELIGNTVMWIDPGIDTGKIIATECTPLSGRETLTQIQTAVIEHGFDLYVRSIRTIESGLHCEAIPQERIAKGQTFFSRQWGFLAMARATVNYFIRYRPERMSLDARTRQLDGIVVFDPKSGLVPAADQLRRSHSGASSEPRG